MSDLLEISWAAGKFVYPKNGSSALHFMPLPDFLLDSALDISLLLLMRFLRRSHVPNFEKIASTDHGNSQEKNFYEILNVPKNSSREVIQRSYWELARKLHPDTTGKSSSLHAQELLTIQNAYKILSDDNKRRHYDLTLRFGTNNILANSNKSSRNRPKELIEYQVELKSEDHPFSNSYDQLVEWQRSIYLDQIVDFVNNLILALYHIKSIQGVIDIFPGIGLLFEAIKFEFISETPERNKTIDYSNLRFIAIASIKQYEIFQSLHAFDDIECEISDCLSSFSEDRSKSLLILNYYQAIRDGLDFDYTSYLVHHDGLNSQSIALILVVSTSNENLNLYTVNRNKVFIPSKKSVESFLISTGRNWFKHYLSFDKSYFLCDESFSSEFYLMLAYTSSKMLELSGFSVISD
ncbi:J domain-containing protein [Leptolyngbya sp. PCC 6406]|uniref:J domain-containing protein n=1 Tax=Leptolyngbya sp. PCC 6406 TaxID=1173264 RepID=UPI0002ABE9E6|nr:J domain-containing protein [Leptolyngbya sp. PCC 6406]